MGTLFAYEGLTEEVLQAYRNAYHYLQLGKDSLTSAYALRDLGRAFNLLEITDSTIYYYNKAYQLANSNGDIQREVNILEELAGIYIQMGKYDEALKTLQETNSKWQDEKDINYDVWGNFYVSIGQKIQQPITSRKI